MLLYIIIALISFVVTFLVYAYIDLSRRNFYFFRKKCVRILVVTKSRGFKNYYRIPKSGSIEVFDNTYVIDNKSPFLISKKMATYAFIEGNPHAIDLANKIPEKDINNNDGMINSILRSHFLRDIVIAQKGGLEKKLVMFAAIIAVVMLAGFYLLYSQIQSLKVVIDTIVTGGTS